MRRIIDASLNDWKVSAHRKPLIIRGARQVGKTTAIRSLGETFESFVEINFEASRQWQTIFEGNLEPEQLLINLQLVSGKEIIPGKTLLFFDEVQVCPQALLSLRYFYESLPELHLIAAGSLLEFAIDEVGIPVGRVQFLYMYPMSFIEFLWALDQAMLAEAMLAASMDKPLHNVVHEKLNRFQGEYMAIGGMPEAVMHWCKTHDYHGCVNLHHDLLTAYRQDFNRYAQKVQIKYVEHLFQYIAHQAGQVFKYSRIPGDFRKRELAPALALLIKANIVIPVQHSAGQGIPLGAQTDVKKFKLIMLDVALTQALLGLKSSDWMLDVEKSFINKGTIAEVFVGQELLVYGHNRQAQTLYYWQRDQPTSQAEVDYLIVKDEKVIPVEVKAGKGSTLRSLHSFLQGHLQTPYGIRFSTQNYSLYEKIHSVPLYAIGSILDEKSL